MSSDWCSFTTTLSPRLRNIRLQQRGQVCEIQCLPPLFIWTWFILQAEDSPLYVMVHFAQSQQSDIAARFILPKEMAYFGPKVLLRKETSLYWGGDSILALSPCQHPHSKQPNPEWSGITGLQRIFSFFLTAKETQTLSITSSGPCEDFSPMNFRKSKKRKSF